MWSSAQYHERYEGGQCWVFPRGISWDLGGEDGSARWEEITGARRSNHSETEMGPTGVNVTFVQSAITWYYCEVLMADGRSKMFCQTYRHSWQWPVSWKNLKPVPGKTKRVNIKQLGRLIKRGVAR
jgi:hypothetical protein